MNFLFDLDGTLLDTPRGIGQSVRAAFSSAAQPPDDSLSEFFAIVAGADDVKRAKPAPDLALRVAAELAANADECTVIGDSILDMGMGTAANMRTVGVTWGVNTFAELHSAGASVVVEDVESLADALTDGH